MTVDAPTALPSAALRPSARVMGRATTPAPAWPAEAHANGRCVSSRGRCIVHDAAANDGRGRDYSPKGADHTLLALTSCQHGIFRPWSGPRLTGPLWCDIYLSRT